MLLRPHAIQKMGFDPLESERVLRQHKTIQASVQALLSRNGICYRMCAIVTKCSFPTVQKLALHEDTGATGLMKSKVSSLPSEPPKMERFVHHMSVQMILHVYPINLFSSNPTLQLKSLWVGNINSTDITEELLQDLFGRCCFCASVKIQCGRIGVGEERGKIIKTTHLLIPPTPTYIQCISYYWNVGQWRFGQGCIIKS